MVHTPWRILPSSGHAMSQLGLFSMCKKDNLRKKKGVNISARSELRISGNLRNGERPETRNTKHTKIEREIQSHRGYRLLAILPADNPPLVGWVIKGATYHSTRVSWPRSWMAVQEVVRMEDYQGSSQSWRARRLRDKGSHEE